jgi:DNA-binding transcriptional MerR regulator
MKYSIPDKLYFKIGEVAKLADVPTHVLRYWESEFPGIRPKRANSKQRLYRRDDITLILTIKELLHERGYTIAGARKLVETGEKQAAVLPAAKPKPPTTAAEMLVNLKKELKALEKLLKNNRE